MKQVIVVNRALRLPTGKLAAQVAHAAVASLLESPPENQISWLQVGMPKIVLEVADEAALLELHEAAQKAHLPACLIHDAGKTVVEAGTITCLGIGPAPVEEVDAVTGKLSLLP
ncbi:MAG TPA: peptidyl-tRNA hydrolase Pth2 [Ktedonobacteraceae bacterium]|nr:peptidyl-tRNA hydrolase Pth2 [Ktedonobacteraceae bacterium]